MVIATTIKEGYKQTELGVIPEDWDARPIGDFFEFKNGLNKAKSFFGHGSPIVNYMDVYRNRGLYTKNIQGCVEVNKQEIKSFGVKKGDVFFTRTSETVEEIGISSVLLDDLINGVFSGFILRGRPKNNDLEDPFKEYCFSSRVIRKQIQGKSTYTTRALTNGRVLSNVKIFYPPKLEQLSIATALSDTDALIENLEKLIVKKNAIKQGTMQLLLTGKKRLPGFSGKWEVKKLRKIGETYGGLSGKTKSDFNEGKYPYIPFMNIMSNPVIDLQYFDYVNIRGDEKQNKATKGDLFFNGSSETPEEVGMCSVLQNDIPNLYLNSFCFGFRLNKDLKTNGLYLSYFFRSPMGRQLIFSLAQGATRYNLSKTNFMKLEIPYPEPTEQTAIVSILFDIDTEIEKLEQKKNKYILLKQGLMQQLLTGKIRIHANN